MVHLIHRPNKLRSVHLCFIFIYHTTATNIRGGNYCFGVNAHKYSCRMKIGKDKVYTYYSLFKKNLSVEEIYSNYKKNKRHCGRKKNSLNRGD